MHCLKTKNVKMTALEETTMSLSSLNGSSVFGEKRNILLSRWNFLFEDNPKEWIGFKPVLGLFVYPCYACRHMFSSLQSLQDHVNRRVVVIKYNCIGCRNDILTFYNRCSFLLHSRDHFDLDRGKINLSEMDTFPLPISLAGFLPLPNIPFIYSSEEPEIDENIYVNTQFYTPNVKDKGRDVISLKPNDLVFRQEGSALVLKQICQQIPKCQFITQEEQRELRQRNLFTTELNNNVQNEQAEMTVKEEPDEDYGQQVTMPVIAKVESLQEKGFQLPCCLDCMTYQNTTMAEHYRGENKPVDESLSCSICKFVAPTECSLKAHIRIHNKEKPHVCPDCGKDFPSWDELCQHMIDVCFHLAKHVRFKCPGKKCGKLFATKATLAVHFTNHLKCLFMCSDCNTVFFNQDSAEEHAESHNKNCTFSKLYDCSLCPSIDPLNDYNYIEHVNLHTEGSERGMYVYTCKRCRSCFRSTGTYAFHTLKCTAKQNNSEVKKVLESQYLSKECEKCHTKIIYNQENVVRICNKCKLIKSRPKAGGTKRYYCILCNKQINVDEKISHMKVCKYSKPRVIIPMLPSEDLTQISFGSSGSESSSTPTKLDSKTSKSSDGEESVKRKRKRIYIPNYRNKKPEIELDLTADQPIQFDGTYHCRLCDYSDTQRSNFHDHIKIHRDISTAYQCMECGECFVVKPSLIKHLVHFHNISDHETYLKANDCYDVVAMKELEEVMNLAPGESKEPVKENQCRVCLEEFTDKTALNKHFRIHGMAFLMKNAK